MEKSIVCPFCDRVIAISGNWKCIECSNCKKQLNRWDWHQATWTAPNGENFVRTDGDSILHSRFAETELCLNESNINIINLDIDRADRVYTAAAAFVHKHDKSWFLTAENNYHVRINGKHICKHAELSPGDTISIHGAEMHFTSDNKIVAGKPDFGVKNIELKNLSAGLGVKTLSIPGLNIQAGEFVGILGPSGCGKSSLLEIMVGLRRDVSGKYLIDGEDFYRRSAVLNFAYVPQDIALHQQLTLDQEINCFQKINIHSPISPDSVDRLLRRFDLESQRKNATGKLSGGQRRRAGIMLELLRDPAILFLDEPTAGLDPKFEAIVMNDLKSLARQGRIVICSTHIMDNIDLLDKVIFMNKNAQVEFFGTPDELLKKYRVDKPVELYDIEPEITYQTAAAKPEKKKQKADFSHWSINNQEMCGYLKRMFLEISKIDFKAICKSPLSLITAPLGILLIQPMLIALTLNFACAAEFFNIDKDLGFYCCIAVFWLGMNNSIRELVKERIPGRCLERLRRVKLGSYLGAKITWMSLLCVIQIIIFYSVLFLCRVPTAHESDLSKTTDIFHLSIGLMFLLVGIAGGFIGLVISAFNKKENAAICFLPMVIIPVLFFSRTTMTNFGKGKNNEFAEKIAKVMPCYGAEKAIAVQVAKNYDIRNKNENIDTVDWNSALLQLFSYIAVCLIMISICQNKKEKEWGGR